MDTLADYIEKIAAPTLDDFGRNEKSERHAFLAAVAIYHAIDRAKPINERGKRSKPRHLREKWHRESPAFYAADMMAHHLKHVRSDLEHHNPNKPEIPFWMLIFNSPDVSEKVGRQLTEGHNLYYLLQDALRFVQSKI